MNFLLPGMIESFLESVNEATKDKTYCKGVCRYYNILVLKSGISVKLQKHLNARIVQAILFLSGHFAIV